MCVCVYIYIYIYREREREIIEAAQRQLLLFSGQLYASRGVFDAARTPGQHATGASRLVRGRAGLPPARKTRLARCSRRPHLFHRGPVTAAAGGGGAPQDRERAAAEPDPCGHFLRRVRPRP